MYFLWRFLGKFALNLVLIIKIYAETESSNSKGAILNEFREQNIKKALMPDHHFFNANKVQI
jgi:hypothetical protein